MPYIKDENNRRTLLRKGHTAQNAGELNFQIFSYIKEVGIDYEKSRITSYVSEFLGNDPNYQKYNDMTGCLIRCYKEIIRRLDLDIEFLLELVESYDKEIATYEDVKIKENGDV